jgi:RHS repeat-associated protein
VWRYPDLFGGGHIVTDTCSQNYKFTRKERGTEAQLDDFGVRYYSSTFGRFQSADWSDIPAPVSCADLGNPQTLNLYARLKNNPFNLTDAMRPKVALLAPAAAIEWPKCTLPGVPAKLIAHLRRRKRKGINAQV